MNLATEASGFELGTISGPDGSVAITEKVALTRATTTNLSAVLVKSDGSVSYVVGDYISGPHAGKYGQMLGNIRTKPPYSGDISGASGQKRVVVRSSVPKGAAAGPEVRVDPVTGEIGEPTAKGPAGGGPSGSPRGSVSGQDVHAGTASGEIADQARGVAPPVEGPLLGEGMAVGGSALLGEMTAMLEMAWVNLGIPLVLYLIERNVAAGNQELIREAWKAAIPEVEVRLRRLGVGEHPSGEFASLLQQTKGGKIVYANISFEIDSPYMKWHSYGRMSPEEAGQWTRDTGQHSKGMNPEKLPYRRIKLNGVNVSTTNINRDEGRSHYVWSFPVYDPKALAPELLTKMPATA